MEHTEVFQVLSVLLEMRREALDMVEMSEYGRARQAGEAEGLLKAVEVIIDANCI